MNRYAPEIEAEMRAFFHSLSGKDRRRYAAIEARKLGYGGHSSSAAVLGGARHTVATGRAELRAAFRARAPRERVSPVVDASRASK